MRLTEGRPMGEVLLLAIILVGFIGVEGFFSSIELALISTPASEFRRLHDKGVPGAGRALELKKNPERFLATCLLGNHGSVVANTTLCTALLLSIFGPQGEWVAVAALPFLLLFFGEMLPKAVGQAGSVKVALRGAPLLWFVGWMLHPVVFVLSRVSRTTLRLTGRAKGSEAVRREDLQMALKLDPSELELTPEERLFLDRLFRFQGRRVEKVMKPLVEVVALPGSATVLQATARLNATGFSRLPIYQDRIDNLIGYVDSFDLLGHPEPRTGVRQIMRPLEFVPETARLDRVLQWLNQKGERLAAVVDEYGGAVGVVTLEDIYEEITGQIEDEFDRPQIFLEKLGPGRWRLNPRIEIDELNRQLKLRLPTDGGYETLGGLILERLGHIPKPGETVDWRDVTFIVTEADARSIRQVELQIGHTPGAAGEVTYETDIP